jgi:hypothetical protein
MNAEVKKKPIDIQEAYEDIEEYLSTIDTKEYSHNLITITLRIVAKDHGYDAANKIVDDMGLESYGYHKEEGE